MIASLALLVEVRPLHYGVLFAITLVWLVAGARSHGAVSPAEVYGRAAPPRATGNPVANVFELIRWTGEPYGPILAAQGLFLGLMAAGGYYAWREKQRGAAA